MSWINLWFWKRKFYLYKSNITQQKTFTKLHFNYSLKYKDYMPKLEIENYIDIDGNRKIDIIKGH